ncbi:hypothetical protein JXL83_08575 [candidate division WOR-3 bacterium]|nr:hypothetical protein [candidate division WOR-3 bacterium]
MKKEETIKARVLMDFLRKNLKGIGINEIMSELEISGITGEELEEEILSLIPRFRQSGKGEIFSDERLLSLIDNLTEEGMMHFLQIWDSGMLDEKDINFFLEMIENRSEEKMNVKTVEIIINCLLINKG